MSKKITATIENDFFSLNKELSPPEEYKLRKYCCWCDALDFANIEYYYHSGEGYTSFLPEIKNILETEFGYDVSIEDKSTLSKPEFKAEFKLNYRPRQEEAVDTVISKRYGIIEAPPGFGKTAMIAAIVAKLGKKALIITEDTKPCYDAIKAIKQFTTIENVGVIAGDEVDIQPVSVCLIQKASSLIKNRNEEFLKYLKELKVIIVDECHHTVSETYSNIIEMCFGNLEYRLGVSATPLMREDGTTNKTKGLLGNVVYRIAYPEAIDLNICVPCTLVYEDFHYDEDIEEGKGLSNYNSLVKECITENYSRNLQYANMAKDFIKDGISCAIIVDKHKHAYNLQKLIPNSAVVIGPDPKSSEEREELWQKLQNQDVMCAISTLLDEAANIPSLGAVLIASNQKTQIRTIQRLRSLRTFKGKTVHGHWEKTRGYVYTTIDHAPYLKDHSKKKVKIIKEYLEGHDLNEVIKLGS